MVLDILQGILQRSIEVFFTVWWIALPLGLGFMAWQFWLYYIYIFDLRKQKWVLLEIKIPQSIEKTPKAMEQVFSAFYQIYSFGLKFVEKYWEGHLREDYISCEIAGNAGAVNFYVRTPVKYKNLVESAIYSQYSDAEIREAEDFRLLWPKTLPNDIYDIAGSDYQLARENSYPIRTYEYFEESQKEKRLDPIAAVVEVMSRLKEDEALWMQIFIRPVDASWKEESEELIAKLAGRKKPEPRGSLYKVGEFIKNLLNALFRYPQWKEEEKKREENRLLMMTSGEKDVIEAIENKISKLAFETNLRFVYIDRKDSFSPLNVSAMMATFQQFSALNLNSLKPRIKTYTMTPAGYPPFLSLFVTNIQFLKKRIKWYRKRRLWDNYIKLKWPHGKKFILNIEELATIYHFPSIAVEAPLLRKLPVKKGEPPQGLPIQ